MNRDVHNSIAREYEIRQKRALDACEERKTQLYAEIPELLDIEDSIHKLGLKYNRMILLSGQSEQILFELSRNIEMLKQEKERILTSSNINPKVLVPQYQCSKCLDTGYITDESGTVRCSCYKQQLIHHLFSMSNINLLGEETFETFNEMLYPDEIDSSKYGIAISPRENIVTTKNICMAFAGNIDDPEQKNLFFSGRTGVGKTFLSLCIARELLNKGRTVLYLTAPMLFEIITEYKLKAFKEENYDADKYQSLFSVELLIIDDLGTETLSDSRYAELLNILNSRQNKNAISACKTIISTNLDPKKLYELYTERIMSRIMGHFDRLVLAGKDIRSLSTASKLSK